MARIVGEVAAHAKGLFLFILILLAGGALSIEANRQDRAQDAVWLGCLHSKPPSRGDTQAELDKQGKFMETCFASHGYRPQMGFLGCDPGFPSRREAPFCYIPESWYDRQLFWVNNLWTLIA